MSENKEQVEQEAKIENSADNQQQENLKTDAQAEEAVSEAQAGDEAVDADKVAEEKSEEEKLSEELAALKDKHIRLTAEFDNFRKRTMKEKLDLVKTGGEGVLKNLLPVVDDFERAMQSIETAEDIESLKEGVNLIYNKFKSYLDQNGIKEIEAVDAEFDTDKHEALTKIPAPTEEQKGKVVDVIEKGYYIHEKVLRFAKVVVGD